MNNNRKCPICKIDKPKNEVYIKYGKEGCKGLICKDCSYKKFICTGCGCAFDDLDPNGDAGAGFCRTCEDKKD
jgi:hypothetical protein